MRWLLSSSLYNGVNASTSWGSRGLNAVMHIEILGMMSDKLDMLKKH